MSWATVVDHFEGFVVYYLLILWNGFYLLPLSSSSFGGGYYIFGQEFKPLSFVRQIFSFPFLSYWGLLRAFLSIL